jgi:hypothetical protein
MFRCLTNIVINQKPTLGFPLRNKVLTFDFVTSFEASSGWRDLSNKGKVIIPKNLFYRDENNILQPLFGNNVNIGGFSSAIPLFLRGDSISITSGYKYINSSGLEVPDVKKVFYGYISNVSPKIPIEIEIEDNMWALKQIAVSTHTFLKTDTLNDILKFMLKGSVFTVNTLETTTFGAFSIGNETVAQVLQRLQKEYHFEFYFRDNELRGGADVYVLSEALSQNFIFQNNIISDELAYKRKDDIVLSAIASNTLTERTGKFTKDGHAKTKQVRLEVLVTLFNNKQTIREIKRGDVVPENDEGERRTFFFTGATTIDELSSLALKQLNKYYYTGLRGKFLTFAIPYVRTGDIAIITNKKLPEQNGRYIIKSVKYTGGVAGGRQEIELDYKLING